MTCDVSSGCPARSNPSLPLVDVLSTGDKSGDLSSYPASTALPLASLPRPGDLAKMKKAAYVTVVEQPAGKGLRLVIASEI